MVKAVIRKSGSIFLVTAGLVLFSLTAYASGGGITSVGAVNKGAGGDTGSREWVELQQKDALLIGRPNHYLIKLITVYAPGGYGTHLILRELKLADGRLSVLISAPNSILKRTLRATIYLRYPNTNLVLLEQVGKVWKQRKPVSLTVLSNDSHTNVRETLLAFSVKGLGMYWILRVDSGSLSASSDITQHTSASSILGGGLSRGLLPWFWSVMLFAIGAAISYWLHTIERKKDM